MTILSESQHSTKMAIIGAGLSGLYLAYLLTQQFGRHWVENHVRIYEAQPRAGGRILGAPTKNADNSLDVHLDLGPSWLWPVDQPLIDGLIATLQLPLVQQWQQGDALIQTERNIPAQRIPDPKSYARACRIKGGTQNIITALLDTLPKGIINTNHCVIALHDESNQVRLRIENHSITKTILASKVIFTLPPRLLSHNITFSPPLSTPLLNTMQSTPTWMAGHAKMVAQYETAFWRQQGLSGSALGHFSGSVLAEVFDCSGPDANPAALGAFIALPAELRESWREDLPALILDQLITLFGPAAAAPLTFSIQDWATQVFTATPLDQQPLFDHPEYGHPWFALDHWNDKLFFCGTETAAISGGYMEGALHAAQRVFDSLHISLSTSTRHEPNYG